ncbi:MAG: ElyC/SanA/YdcF family protein, partial [Spirochaetota bacterium]
IVHSLPELLVIDACTIRLLDHSTRSFVLGAAAWGNKPSPVFKERLNHALDLYRQGLCRYIIITGGKGAPGEPGESVIGRKYALKNGVPESAILIENYSRSTEQNILYARLLARQHDLSTFAIVSDPYHLKRAVIIAEHEGMQVYPSPTPTSRFRSHEVKLHFLFKEAYYISLYRIQYMTGIQLMKVYDEFTL